MRSEGDHVMALGLWGLGTLVFCGCYGSGLFGNLELGILIDWQTGRCMELFYFIFVEYAYLLMKLEHSLYPGVPHSQT